MRLIQLSDCHLFGDCSRTGYASVNPYQSLKAVLDQTASLLPDLVLVTGDISGDSSEQSYQHFLTLIQPILPNVEVKIIAGNHDSNPFFEKSLSEYSLVASHPWVKDNWVMHGLDSRHEHTLGKVSDLQLDLLQAALNHHPSANHFIALHHHPLPADSWMDNHPLVDAEAFISLVNANPQIKAVVHGHVHFPLQRQIGTTPVLGVPSTCWQWEMTTDFAISSERPGLRIFDLQDNGSWTTQIRRV
ncbi:metallophosphoesterase [Alteromonas ponticola]|uniref:Metallophosphoesterase n=1 Tax=Alteromonas aquimaris TaxID=2998417 RepID=A0ABT3P989_9ALTE|nr:metallophosphoesterase [Alteromonas aquimaris]MCW8109348.1 metallophosphoesterase [Alteromonas aquimaris]